MRDISRNWQSVGGATAISPRADRERYPFYESVRDMRWRGPTNRVRALAAAGTLVALVATGGSLYFSLGMGLFPCRLCWYQRILMYPQVVILGVATFESRREVVRTSLPMVLLGGALAAYHSALQVSGGSTCTAGGCAAVQFRLGGLLTIPNLSLLGFACLTVLLAAMYMYPAASSRSV